MHWRKIGRIFNPFDPLPGAGRALQSPQAVVLQDRLRIYFASRARDEFNGASF